jgi:hypothetical protein
MTTTTGRNNMTRTKVYYPGNGYRYAVVCGEIPLENGGSQPFVALPDYGVSATMTTRPAEWGYVADKLRLNETDARAVFECLELMEQER